MWWLCAHIYLAMMSTETGERAENYHLAGTDGKITNQVSEVALYMLFQGSYTNLLICNFSLANYICRTLPVWFAFRWVKLSWRNGAFCVNCCRRLAEKLRRGMFGVIISLSGRWQNINLMKINATWKLFRFVGPMVGWRQWKANSAAVKAWVELYKSYEDASRPLAVLRLQSVGWKIRVEF